MDTDTHLLPDMRTGDVVMGDFNARHAHWMDGEPASTRGRDLVSWSSSQGAEKRGPDGLTHDKGGKLDLIFIKSGADLTTMIYHNGLIEHSDHQCQSLSLSIPALPSANRTKPDYSKANPAMILDLVRRCPRPASPLDLDAIIAKTVRDLPQKRVAQTTTRLPDALLNLRRDLRRLYRKRRGSDD